MSIVIVGRSGSRRVICWVNVVLLATVLSAATGLGTTLAYWMLTGSWTALPAAISAFGILTIVGSGVVRGLQTPVDQLREV